MTSERHGLEGRSTDHRKKASADAESVGAAETGGKKSPASDDRWWDGCSRAVVSVKKNRPPLAGIETLSCGHSQMAPQAHHRAAIRICSTCAHDKASRRSVAP